MSKLTNPKNGVNKKIKANTRRMSKDPIRGKLKREQLYNAIAYQIVKLRRGTLTLDEIALRMGMSKGTIYYYFSSKAEMLYKMWMHLYDMEMKAINDVLETQNLGNRERLQEVIRAFILTNCKNWHLARSLWNDMALREATPVIAMVINRRTGRLAAKLLELVKEVNEEDGTEQKDSRVMVALIFSYMTSVSRWYKGTGRLSAEQVADHSVRLISSGIFAAPSS